MTRHVCHVMNLIKDNDMKKTTNFSQRLRGSAIALALSGATCFLATTSASADEASAKALFKVMSDYVAGQKAISFSYDAMLEIVSSDLQKVGFASSGTLDLNRPDKVRMTRTGGFADVELSYDGKTLAAMGKNLNVFTKVETTGTIDELIDTLRFDYGLEVPAADLLSSNPYDMMMENVTDAKDLGSGVINGKECDHLAFRTEDTDWQIWITQGDKPYPCRFTITSKIMAQAPSYTIEVRDWKTGDEVASDDFQLKTGDAKEVQISEISGLDEVPDLSGKGDAQ
jgi:hypothetical protein